MIGEELSYPFHWDKRSAHILDVNSCHAASDLIEVILLIGRSTVELGLGGVGERKGKTKGALVNQTSRIGRE